MSRIVTAGSGVVMLFMLCGSAAAHHSHAEFYHCTQFTIEGEIERISWANPHIVLSVDTDDSQKYMIVWFSLRQLARAGVTSETLAAGDRVLITGSRNRNPELNVIALVSDVHRPSDGWQWSRDPGLPAQCPD